MFDSYIVVEATLSKCFAFLLKEGSTVKGNILLHLHVATNSFIFEKTSCRKGINVLEIIYKKVVSPNKIATIKVHH